jgi:hypothetical protein
MLNASDAIDEYNMLLITRKIREKGNRK